MFGGSDRKYRVKGDLYQISLRQSFVGMGMERPTSTVESSSASPSASSGYRYYLAESAFSCRIWCILYYCYLSRKRAAVSGNNVLPWLSSFAFFKSSILRSNHQMFVTKPKFNNHNMNRVLVWSKGEFKCPLTFKLEQLKPQRLIVKRFSTRIYTTYQQIQSIVVTEVLQHHSSISTVTPDSDSKLSKLCEMWCRWRAG